MKSAPGASGGARRWHLSASAPDAAPLAQMSSFRRGSSGGCGGCGGSRSVRFREESCESNDPAGGGRDEGRAVDGVKSVRFGTVEIREYPRIIGDNPAVTSGPPMTIDWAYDPSTVLTLRISQYERTKPNPPRDPFGLMVPRSIRENWLMSAGHTREEIVEAVRAVNKAKAKRNQTIHNLYSIRVLELAESARRKYRRWMGKEESDKVVYRRWLAEKRRAVIEGRTTTTVAAEAAPRRAPGKADEAAAAAALADRASPTRVGVDSRAGDVGAEEGTNEAFSALPASVAEKERFYVEKVWARREAAAVGQAPGQTTDESGRRIIAVVAAADD